MKKMYLALFLVTLTGYSFAQKSTTTVEKIGNKTIITGESTLNDTLKTVVITGVNATQMNVIQRGATFELRGNIVFEKDSMLDGLHSKKKKKISSPTLVSVGKNKKTKIRKIGKN